ncbi:dienelactone hydrolase family protein [Sorangium sp. So ce315]|uniref:dienelactone hydrolase family protein n=1 Tax=Sorangium sp. So ce315 TaxID=3133299 RepID=UPI003F609B78
MDRRVVMGPSKPRAPEGDLATFARERFTHGGVAHDVYRKGKGPSVLVLTEMPGISPQVLGFADRVVALGCTAVLPSLFGTPGRDPLEPGVSGALYGLSSMVSVCISKEFTVFATGRSSPVVDWLRALAASEHERCGGPGVGVVGMCFTGGFALAMAADARVLAPVMSQPSLPVVLTKSQRRTIDCDSATLDAVAQRCDREGLRVMGLRFKGDPFVPEERFQLLRERLGEGFVAVELEQADGHPEGPLKKHHSVLTGALIDAPGEPTRAALDRVLQLFRDKLLAV